MTAMIIILVVFALMVFIPLRLCWAAKDYRCAKCGKVILKEKIYCKECEK
jgi:hypothetical protein